VPRSIPEYLKQRLDPSQYRRLEAMSQGFTRPLFAIDPSTGRFEAALDLDPDKIEDDRTLDALCLACELLSEAGVEFDLTSPVVEQAAPSGTIQLTFDFPSEEESVYLRFQKLLRENTDPGAGFHADFQNYPWGYRVVVDLVYHGDLDYQRKKDILDWLLLISKRKDKGDPFQGSRL